MKEKEAIDMIYDAIITNKDATDLINRSEIEHQNSSLLHYYIGLYFFGKNFEKSKKYLESGGKFILPLPKVTII